MLIGPEDLNYTELIDLEYGCFSQVKNAGGVARCQTDRRTFFIMRLCQFQSWMPSIVRSYRNDLEQAIAANRNLFTEKYAYMMESTDPLGFDLIKQKLPVVEFDVLNMVEAIVSIVLEWADSLRMTYPALIRRGRPLYTKDDSYFVTSFETYTRGELKTYSKRTLRMLLDYYVACQEEAFNVLMDLERFVVRCYGYPTLQDAELKLSSS